ncbi:MAG: hypothetical protein ACK5L3_15800 [Oscillospiraceae bacterium]
MNNILTKLRTQAQEQVRAIEAETAAMAKDIVDGYAKRAEKEKPGILAQYQKEAALFTNRRRQHMRLQETQALLAEKEQLAEEVLEEVRAYFKTQTDEEYLAMFKSALRQSLQEARGERPIIIVPLNREKVITAEFGGRYTIKAGQIGAGFILFYSTYNFTYELEKEIAFEKEELEREILQTLFPQERAGGTDASAP